MNSGNRIVTAFVLGLLFAAGCGQKGPLYLPGNPSRIKTEVPPPQQGQADEDDEEKEKEPKDE
ncbi:MAG: lipoprotein [Woeseia sp.]